MMARLIPSDIEAARRALDSANIRFEEGEIVPVVVESRAGELAMLSTRLAEGGVGIRALYVTGSSAVEPFMTALGAAGSVFLSHDVIADAPAECIRQAGRGHAIRALREDRGLTGEETLQFRDQLRMVMPEQVGAKTANQIEHFDKFAVFSTPETVSLRLLVNRIEPDGMQKTRQRRPTAITVIEGFNCRELTGFDCGGRN
jgi:hypothetical protein